MEKDWEVPSGSEAAIDSSNVGFKLLKKHGWKEGTGLGVSEQGRLEPIEAHWKNNKRGLGAYKGKMNSPRPLDTQNRTTSEEKNVQEPASRKAKKLSKRMRKMQEIEIKLQEKEFERSFFRDFWPDNV